MHLTFIETPNFTRGISDLLTDDDYTRLQRVLLQMPDLGTIIIGRRYQEVQVVGERSRQEWRS